MTAISKSAKVGDKLSDHVRGPITRTTLALFAGASNDHVRLHIDSDYVKEAGMPDVFAHGMLSMAFLGRLVTSWVPQKQVRGLGTRFTSITWVGDVITAVNGKTTANVRDLRQAIKDNHAGDSIRIEVVRGRNRQALAATAEEREMPEFRAFNFKGLDHILPPPDGEWHKRLLPSAENEELRSQIRALEKRLQELEKRLQK